MPSSRRVEEFQSFYFARFQKQLDYDEAADALTRLMQYVYVVEQGKEMVPGSEPAISHPSE